MALREDQKQALRRRLQDRHRELGQRAHAIRRDTFGQTARETIGELSSYDNHQGEAASQYFQRELDLGDILDLERSLSEVEGALERLQGGDYGTCARCGREIPFDRLWAEPETALCVDCAVAAEGERQAPTVPPGKPR